MTTILLNTPDHIDQGIIALRKHPTFAKALADIEPFQWDDYRVRAPSLENMVMTILGQQLSIRVAAVLRERLIEALGGSFQTNGLLALEQTGLRALGISNAKAKTMLGLATSVQAGELDFEDLVNCTDQEVSDILLPFWGIGEWTVECLLLFDLNRADIWPAKDLGLLNAIKYLEGREAITIKEGIEFSAELTPYRSLASKILWKWINLYKEKKVKST